MNTHDDDEEGDESSPVGLAPVVVGVDSVRSVEVRDAEVLLLDDVEVAEEDAQDGRQKDDIGRKESQEGSSGGLDFPRRGSPTADTA